MKMVYATSIKVEFISCTKYEEINSEVAVAMLRDFLMANQKLPRERRVFGINSALWARVVSVTPQNANTFAPSTDIKPMPFPNDFPLESFNCELPGKKADISLFPDYPAIVLDCFERRFSGMNVPMPSQAIALTGPPGTGKTMYAREIGRLARANGMVYIEVPVSHLQNSYIGESARRIYMLSKKLPEKCVVLIDETDMLVGTRAEIRSYGSLWETVTAMNSFLGGLGANQYAIIVTNNAIQMDPSVMNRCFQLEFALPDRVMKQAFIRKLADENTLSIGAESEERICDRCQSFRDLEREVLLLCWERMGIPIRRKTGSHIVEEKGGNGREGKGVQENAGKQAVAKQYTLSPIYN